MAVSDKLISPLRFSLQRGYTLLEIMMVVGIISLLLGAGVYYLAGSLDEAREQRVYADIAAITTALKTYEMQNLRLPTTEQGLQALVTRPTTEPVPRRWRQLMERLPEDPWGSYYRYQYPGKHNAGGFDLYSLGPDRVESDENIGNWQMN